MKLIYQTPLRMKNIGGLSLTALLSLSISVNAQTGNTHYGGGAGNLGTYNSAYGAYAGDVVTGNQNCFFGAYPGNSLTNSNGNVFIGHKSGYSLTGPSYNDNVFIGNQAGLNSTYSIYSVFVGSNAGYSSIGTQSTYVGYSAGYNNGNGTSNSYFGYNSGFNNVGGSQNTALGVQSLASLNSGLLNYNTVVGYRAGWNSAGSNNIFIGASAGAEFSGSSNIAIGNITTPQVLGYSNTVSIGHDSKALINYGIVLGNSNHKVGIRQDAPQWPLHVQNAYTDGNTWINSSDKNLKENFLEVSKNDGILGKVVGLPIKYWNYIGDTKKHMGPIAQDFYAAFSLGGSETSISTVDGLGISLAAIKELGTQAAELESKVKNQSLLLNSILQELDDLKKRRTVDDNGAKLFQNAPNPTSNGSVITMYLPQQTANATLHIYNLEGATIKEYKIQERGEVSLAIQKGEFKKGMYLYTLIVDGKGTSVNRMIVND